MIVKYIGNKIELKLRLPGLRKHYDFTEWNDYTQVCSMDSNDIDFFLSNPRTFKVETGTITSKNPEPPKPAPKPEDLKFKCKCGSLFTTEHGLKIHQGKCGIYKRSSRNKK